MNKCPKCGGTIMPSDSFCGTCGTAVVVESSNSNVGQSISNDELKRTFIGQNADKIISGKGGSIWLFLFGGIYLLYRKMYLHAVLVIVASLILNVVNPYMTFIVQLVLSFAFYKLYLGFVEDKVNKIRLTNPNASSSELLNICRKQGGTDFFLPLIAGLVCLVIGFLSINI